MRFDILTIFPEFFDSPLKTSILGRALAAGKLACQIHNLRDWTTDKHHCTDDAPYGGGGGMVMLAEPILRALRELRTRASDAPGESSAAMFRAPVIHLSPQGRPLTRDVVVELAALPAMVLFCGAYEGVDERALRLEVDREISIGDYVLANGEPAALVLVSAVARRLEGVLGNPESVPNDSFENGLLDFPHYTRPEVVEGLGVPPVLLSGHHAQLTRWRREQSLERTARRRPDLLARLDLPKEDREYLAALGLWPRPEEEVRSEK
jgi:tRNA (guanine37-N1)-methyltransferase